MRTEISNQFSQVLEKHLPIYERVINKKSLSGRFIASNFWETLACIQNLADGVNNSEDSFEENVIELLEYHNFMIGEFCLIAPESDEAIMLDNLRRDFLDVCINYFSTVKGVTLSKEKVSDIRAFTFRSFRKDLKDKHLNRLNIVNF